MSKIIKKYTNMYWNGDCFKKRLKMALFAITKVKNALLSRFSKMFVIDNNEGYLPLLKEFTKNIGMGVSELGKSYPQLLSLLSSDYCHDNNEEFALGKGKWYSLLSHCCQSRHHFVYYCHQTLSLYRESLTIMMILIFISSFLLVKNFKGVSL